jgi:hypothetical protein
MGTSNMGKGREKQSVDGRSIETHEAPVKFKEGGEVEM